MNGETGITRKADGKCVECGAGLGSHLAQCRFSEAPGDSVNAPPAPTQKELAFEMAKIGEDLVNHPKHYTYGKFEVWDIIIDWGLNYLRGNVVKYVARAGKKNPRTEVQDLEKAKAYLEKEIERVKAQQPQDWK